MRYVLRDLAVAVAMIGMAGAWSSSAAQTRTGAVQKELDRAKAATGIKACSLLTKEEVGKTVGRTISEVMDMGNICEYGEGAASLRVFSGPKPHDEVDWMLKNYKREKETRHPVSGFGAGSFLMFPKPKDQYEGTYAIIVVTAGQRMLMLGLEAEKGKAEAMQPQLVALAKAAVAKLP